MKELGPNEGMNALRHPDCRFCDEYQRLIRGRDAEIKALKAKIEKLEQGSETDVGVGAGTETVCGQVAPDRPSARPASADCTAQPPGLGEEREYDRLVAQETLILDATEAICEAMEPEQQSGGTVTRKELADRLGCSKGHVTQLLAGDRNLTLRTLADMAGALGRKVRLNLEPIPAPPGEKVAQPSPQSSEGGGDA